MFPKMFPYFLTPVDRHYLMLCLLDFAFNYKTRHTDPIGFSTTLGLFTSSYYHIPGLVTLDQGLHQKPQCFNAGTL